MIITKGLCVAQSAARVRDALDISVIVGWAITVNKIEHGHRRARSAQLDLVRLETIVIADGMYQAVAVGLGVQSVDLRRQQPMGKVSRRRAPEAGHGPGADGAAGSQDSVAAWGRRTDWALT